MEVVLPSKRVYGNLLFISPCGLTANSSEMLMRSLGSGIISSSCHSPAVLPSQSIKTT